MSEGLWSWGGPQRVHNPRAGRNVGVSTSACMHTHRKQIKVVYKKIIKKNKAPTAGPVSQNLL